MTCDNEKVKIPITCVTDNLSLHQAVHSTNNMRDKRLLIDIAIIREMIDKQEIRLEWVPGVNQLSDVLTKKGAGWQKLRDVLEKGKF